MPQFHRLDDELIVPLVPIANRMQVSILWKLDARLAEMARIGKEPALRHIRLKWWEEQLVALTAAAQPHDPLLAEVAKWLFPNPGGEQLARLAVDWAASAVADELDRSDSHGATLFALTAQLLGVPPTAAIERAGAAWAAIDALIASDATGEDNRWRIGYTAFQEVDLGLLPRSLAAITGVSRRIARLDGFRSARGEQWTAFRIGVIGR